MKRILFRIFLAGTSLVMLKSCKKDNASPVYNNNPSIFQQYPVIIDNLVAGRWIRYERNIYVNTFRDVLPFPVPGNRAVKIFLVSNHKEIQINHSISFMNGRLWATYSNSDIGITFIPENPILPFSYLVIKVVIV